MIPGPVKITGRRRYNSSSDDDFELYFTGEDRPSSSKKKASSKWRRKQPERSSKQVKALELFRKATALTYRPPAKRRRVETRGGPRSEVLPKETLLDVFCCEDRDTLECLQLACARFDRIVYTKMNVICSRPIYSVRLSQTDFGIHAQMVPVLRGSKPTKRVSPGREVVYNANSIELATEWIFAGLRCAQVCNSFELHNIALSKHFLAQLMDAAPTFNVSGYLDLWFVGFPDDVSPAALIGAFPGLGDVRTKSARLQWKHIDDALLSCYAVKGLWKSFPRATKGVEYDRISERGTLDFCFGYSEQASGSVRDLKLRKPKVTTEFVANLVKAHQSCGHDDPIRLEVADIPKQNQTVLDGCKQTTDADGSFAAVVPGEKALKVSYNAAEDTWFIQRGLE